MTATARSGLRTAWSVVTLFVGRVFVEPVREGRLRDVSWPAGLRPIAIIGLVGYIVAVALVLVSGLIREHVELATITGPGSPTVPRALVWVVMVLTAVAITLGQSGALHLTAWLRWIMTAFTVLVLLLASTPDLSAIPLGRIVAVAASLAIVLLVALRGHRKFAWWEFVVTFLIVAISFAASIAAVAVASRPFGYDFGPVVVSLVLLTVGQLAVPAAMAAGASVTELAVSSATWAVGAIRDRLGTVALVVLLCLVLAWRGYDLVPAIGLIIASPATEWAPLVAAVMFLLLVVGAWRLLARIRGRGASPTTAGLVRSLAATSLIISALITFTIPTAFAQLGGLVVVAYTGQTQALGEVLLAVSTVMSSFLFISLLLVVGGAALIVISLVLARRGRTVLPELLIALGISNLVAGVTAITGWPIRWSESSLSVTATLAALVLLVVLLVRRELTPARLVAVTAALLMAALFAHRDFLADPFAVVLGSAAAATVLLGFLWAFLTGYGSANEDSRRFPRPARVQLVLANALFGATVLAYSVLARDPDAVIDLAQFSDTGARTFGDALIAGSLVVAIAAAVRNRVLK